MWAIPSHGKTATRYMYLLFRKQKGSVSQLNSSWKCNILTACQGQIRRGLPGRESRQIGLAEVHKVGRTRCVTRDIVIAIAVGNIQVCTKEISPCLNYLPPLLPGKLTTAPKRKISKLNSLNFALPFLLLNTVNCCHVAVKDVRRARGHVHVTSA